MSKILLADKQDITRMGLIRVIEQLATGGGSHGAENNEPCPLWKYTEDKTELVLALKENQQAVVILDYTLFDINDADELLILNQRFPETHWLLFSEDLSAEFVRMLVASSAQFSIVMKESPLSEIRQAISYALNSTRFVCQHMMDVLLAPTPMKEETAGLTKTETEILKDIALGMTTKEIAEKRISSFHTVNTHRKNIFRKLGVNNAHEATKYALRAGLVDSAEYYI